MSASLRQSPQLIFSRLISSSTTQSQRFYSAYALSIAATTATGLYALCESDSPDQHGAVVQDPLSKISFPIEVQPLGAKSAHRLVGMGVRAVTIFNLYVRRPGMENFLCAYFCMDFEMKGRDVMGNRERERKGERVCVCIYIDIYLYERVRD